MEEKEIDIVLTAYDLPKCPQVLAMLSAKYPHVKVITMAFKITDDYLSFLQAHEPHGSIMKNDEPEVLHEAIQQVYKFDFYYTPGLERLLHEYQRKKTVGHPVINLTRKEKEILLLMEEGSSRNQIAQQLNVTVNTIDGHSKDIFNKLGVHKAQQAVIKARKLGLLD
ncbi:MAG: response regulator transcription factor [Chitinophagales bacterium]